MVSVPWRIVTSYKYHKNGYHIVLPDTWVTFYFPHYHTLKVPIQYFP